MKCGKLATASDDALAVVNPTVLIEVLSDSSEAYDRGEYGESIELTSLGCHSTVDEVYRDPLA